MQTRELTVNGQSVRTGATTLAELLSELGYGEGRIGPPEMEISYPSAPAWRPAWMSATRLKWSRRDRAAEQKLAR